MKLRFKVRGSKGDDTSMSGRNIIRNAARFKPILGETLCSILLILCVPIFVSASENARPFWTEKSAYIEGHDLYAVGIASNMATSEEGRQKAFDQGKIELMNFAQVTDLEAEGLVIETQMTYEEQNKDGTINVFRLLRIDGKKLLDVQGRLQTESQAQQERLDKVRQELAALEQAILQKQQEFERQGNKMQTNLAALNNLETRINTKAQNIDQRYRDMERLIGTIQERAQQMEQQEEKIQLLLQQVNAKAPTQDASIASLEKLEVELDAKAQKLGIIQQKILSRIQEDSQKSCQYIRPGMTPRDVRELLGDPKGERYSSFDASDVWSYGTTSVNFDSQAVVSTVTGCGP